MAGLSRRVFLGCLPALAAADNTAITGELKRFRDPSTEFDLLRYTDPAHASYLIPAELRSVSQKSNYLLFCCDRSGSNQVYRLDVKNGDMRQLTNVAGIHPSRVVLLPDDRTFCCLHEQRIDLFSIANGKPKHLYESESGWTPTALGMHDDGRLIVIEQSGSKWAIRSTGTAKKPPETLLETGTAVDFLRPRPRANAVLYRKEGKFWLYDYDKRSESEIKTDPITVPCLYWSTDGTSLFYLCRPEGGQGVQLREHFPDSGEDKLIAPTSQFVSFAANRNGSVFVGVSGSKASPYVLLLLRVTRRELALGDHRSTAPEEMVIFFSPDSQRVFFHGDRSGKSCIYGFPTEKLVEPTDT